MKLLFTCLFIVLSDLLFAQQTGRVVITHDTINLNGYIYNYDGTPCTGVRIRSSQKDTVYNLFNNLQATTDRNGYFKLNGAKFDDTLSVQFSEAYPAYNKGSRYIVIYMPFPKQLSSTVYSNIATPYIVTAPKKHNKPIISFTTKSFTKSNFIGDAFEKNPEYPGGMIRYKDEIVKNIMYPEKAIENNIEGTVEIGFTIFNDGTVSNYKILKGIGYGCDEEVIRAMKNMKKWRPGLANGRPVETNFMVDVQFKLTDK